LERRENKDAEVMERWYMHGTRKPVPDLNTNSQIMRGEFWGKENKVYYSSEEEDKESQPFKALASHFWEKNGCFLKRSSGEVHDKMNVPEF
jgi:hypothetical protein